MMLKIKLCRSRNHSADNGWKFWWATLFSGASDGTWSSNQDDSTCKLMLVDTCFRIFDTTKQHKTDLYKKLAHCTWNQFLFLQSTPWYKTVCRENWWLVFTSNASKRAYFGNFWSFFVAMFFVFCTVLKSFLSLRKKSQEQRERCKMPQRRVGKTPTNLHRDIAEKVWRNVLGGDCAPVEELLEFQNVMWEVPLLLDSGPISFLPNNFERPRETPSQMLQTTMRNAIYGNTWQAESPNIASSFCEREDEVGKVAIYQLKSWENPQTNSKLAHHPGRTSWDKKANAKLAELEKRSEPTYRTSPWVSDFKKRKIPMPGPTEETVCPIHYTAAWKTAEGRPRKPSIWTTASEGKIWWWTFESLNEASISSLWHGLHISGAPDCPLSETRGDRNQVGFLQLNQTARWQCWEWIRNSCQQSCFPLLFRLSPSGWKWFMFRCPARFSRFFASPKAWVFQFVSSWWTSISFANIVPPLKKQMHPVCGSAFTSACKQKMKRPKNCAQADTAWPLSTGCETSETLPRFFFFLWILQPSPVGSCIKPDLGTPFLLMFCPWNALAAKLGEPPARLFFSGGLQGLSAWGFIRGPELRLRIARRMLDHREGLPRSKRLFRTAFECAFAKLEPCLSMQSTGIFLAEFRQDCDFWWSIVSAPASSKQTGMGRPLSLGRWSCASCLLFRRTFYPVPSWKPEKCSQKVRHELLELLAGLPGIRFAPKTIFG